MTGKKGLTQLPVPCQSPPTRQSYSSCDEGQSGPQDQESNQEGTCRQERGATPQILLLSLMSKAPSVISTRDQSEMSHCLAPSAQSLWPYTKTNFDQSPCKHTVRITPFLSIPSPHTHTHTYPHTYRIQGEILEIPRITAVWRGNNAHGCCRWDFPSGWDSDETHVCYTNINTHANTQLQTETSTLKERNFENTEETDLTLKWMVRNYSLEAVTFKLNFQW